MILGTRYTVTARHVAPNWQAMSPLTVDVRGDATRGFYAVAPKLGCGRTEKTAEAAIRDLVLANGFTSLAIIEG